ncbi:DEAD-box ATP-dependent RNA helicase 52 [Acorus calamus]|uniref:RNA helicase n=1 Tax=Acorus calamus TaxID=4465 RepID=A0AAV9C6E4_ACOCL|nr:DEAD-box ATP-dependent RNA helicase 52 [Acorus calamus]
MASYVPPHLRRESSAQSLPNNYRNATPKPYPETLDRDDKPSSSFSSAAFRRSGGLAPPPDPEAVFEQWKPSDRVSRLTPEQIEQVRLRLNVDVIVTSDSPPAPAPIESFSDMGLHVSIMKDIAFHEYTRPTSIQAQAMPVALSGRDLLGCAETGSGKTAAFAIPMIQHCLAQPPIQRGDGPLALVLAPTRELAQQIEKEVKSFSRSLESFKTAIVVGGTNISEQRCELRAGVHIVVATPGRFIDHLQQGNTSLSRISFVVLDEADRMLDMGFEPQISEVMKNLPKKHQTLMFSATMPVEIEALAQAYLSKPVQIKVGKVSHPTANVSQMLEKVSGNEKMDRLLSLLVDEASQAEQSGHALPLTIVFVERKTRCDDVVEALVAQGLNAVALHGGRSQLEREAALHEFRSGSTHILVATDVASRGLDVTGVSHVINLDLPKTMEDYVHRIGRTGRAGSSGQATSFYTDRDMFLVAHIRKAISDVESGNTVSYATGKVARRMERESAAAQKEARLVMSKLSVTGAASINIEDKYRYMLTPTSIKKEGVADGAWDD